MKPTFECSCDDCTAACRRKPGWFMPGEVEVLAANMGLSVKELFDTRLAVDWWATSDELGETFVLSPSISTEEAGSEFPGDPLGTCTFFKDGKCEVHEIGKPHECAALTHNGHASHVDVARAWVDQQDQIRELLGRDPESADYDLGSAFLGLFGFRP